MNHAGDERSSRLTFFDAGAIVLSSGSSPALAVGSTVYVSVTSVGVQQPWDACSSVGVAAFDLDKPADMQTEAYLQQQSDEAAGLGGSSTTQYPAAASLKQYRLTITLIPRKATTDFAMLVSSACCA